MAKIEEDKLLTKEEMREIMTNTLSKLDTLKQMTHYEVNLAKLSKVQQELKADDLWDDPDNAKSLGKQEARLQEKVVLIDDFVKKITEIEELLSLLSAESDVQPQDWEDLSNEIKLLSKDLGKIEFETMFSREHDDTNAFVEIQAGQGGTEAQDWAEMLLRMYLRWSDRHKFSSDVLEISAGEVAGIKGASIKVKGTRAYGWLRTETGIHRLVRKSPFNAGNKRHTSFASVFVAPDISSEIAIDINPKDLRIDTYRASGAGGQHVNKTDSAVRITHIPTGVVVQCQNQRSQHQNKDSAMKQLSAKLYLMEEEKKNKLKMEIEGSKDEISWGRQIRSYVLDDSRIKDLRTGLEKGDCPRVLDGDLDDFIIASLKLNSQN